MQRAILLFFIVIGLLTWAGVRVRKTHRELAAVFFTVAGALAFLLVGGLFGLIGG